MDRKSFLKSTGLISICPLTLSFKGESGVAVHFLKAEHYDEGYQTPSFRPELYRTYTYDLCPGMNILNQEPESNNLFVNPVGNNMKKFCQMMEKKKAFPPGYPYASPSFIPISVSSKKCSESEIRKRSGDEKYWLSYWTEEFQIAYENFTMELKRGIETLINFGAKTVYVEKRNYSPNILVTTRYEEGKVEVEASNSFSMIGYDNDHEKPFLLKHEYSYNEYNRQFKKETHSPINEKNIEDSIYNYNENSRLCKNSIFIDTNKVKRMYSKVKRMYSSHAEKYKKNVENYS
jgi:hypothetical protein